MYEIVDSRWDDRGNLVYTKDNKDLEEWYDFDDDGNMTYYKSGEGIEMKWLPSKCNFPIYVKQEADNIEMTVDYDTRSNIISCKDNNGLECTIKYNDKNDMIYYKDSKGFKYSEEDNDPKDSNYFMIIMILSTYNKMIKKMEFENE